MRQTRRTQEIWTLVCQDRTTKGHRITIRHTSQNPDNTRQITRMRTSRNQYKQPNTHPENVQLSQQPLIKGPPSHTQTVTQTHELSMWSAEPIRGSENQLVKKSMKPRPKKHTPTSQKELVRLDSSNLASSLWNY